ncbi:hypothetical protein GGTG_07701 [Gaeumannomyces tritici R3-111a-1]|uniref:Uncharacterized protein n=1 Tax=Gaeumannomyces tritici (strain R3-111a-1) TaxID=644352 RepID=J3P2F4_GAET3|nr:hypothetical protein GGTG_07701 [Gaeumannomyces tritici R3-111a-1]EJT73846.1 hypothetical protein GGTG_07701 [Gaeumannomyces tritici R3-111a-1]
MPDVPGLVYASSAKTCTSSFNIDLPRTTPKVPERPGSSIRLGQFEMAAYTPLKVWVLSTPAVLGYQGGQTRLDSKPTRVTST